MIKSNYMQISFDQKIPHNQTCSYRHLLITNLSNSLSVHGINGYKWICQEQCRDIIRDIQESGFRFA